MKPRSVFVLLLLLPLILSSCRHEVEKQTATSSYTVAEALAETLTVTGGYAAYDDTAVRLYFPESVILATDFAVLYSVRPDDYTEIGVFSFQNDEDLRTAEREMERYLEELKETYLPQAELYERDQKEKLYGAAVRRIGRYVIYTVMSEKEQRPFWKAAEGILT